MAQFDWVEFYGEFAKTLLQYKNNRQVIIDNIVAVYSEAGINLPTLEKDNNIIDIDPFTVFGLFNKSKLKLSNRLAIIKGLADKFDVKTAVPASFDSVPTLNNQNATYYWFVGDRGPDDINNLWELLETALAYAQNPSTENRAAVSKYFDIVINTKGNANSKISMGLYWIAPDVFLNLDSRNEWYIYESGKIPTDIVEKLPKIEPKIAASKYFDIIEVLTAFLKTGKAGVRDFKELSDAAWNYSTQVNEEQKAAKTSRTEQGSALADEDVTTVHYWIYSPGDNANKWDQFYAAGIMGLGWSGIGDLSSFDSKDAMKKKMKETYGEQYSYKNAAHATWQFANEIKPGDIIFVKKGMHKVIGRGVVTGEYQYRPELQDEDYEYGHVRTVDWTHKGEWEHPGQAVMKALTDITPYTDYVEKLNALFADEVEGVEEVETTYPPYDVDKFLEEVYMDIADYNTLVGLIRTKKNVILQGAPGVGKTFAAKRLAYSMMGQKNQDRVMLVQFHQSYTYEDFIEGFRPTSAGSGFEIKKGSFYNFCKKAGEDLENEYFFIIDEINRGNLSKIFGELFMLIENDKRGNSLQLLYSDEKFNVPSNVYIIGMMNTADRSLAMLDYALRRRFAFYTMNPGFNSDGFRAYKTKLASGKMDKLIACVESLNSVIAADDSLGEGFCVGHSYFCNIEDATDTVLSNIVEYELVPLLKEYWFDEPIKVKDWTNNLRSAIK